MTSKRAFASSAASHPLAKKPNKASRAKTTMRRAKEEAPVWSVAQNNQRVERLTQFKIVNRSCSHAGVMGRLESAGRSLDRQSLPCKVKTESRKTEGASPWGRSLLLHQAHWPIPRAQERKKKMLSQDENPFDLFSIYLRPEQIGVCVCVFQSACSYFTVDCVRCLQAVSHCSQQEDLRPFGDSEGRGCTRLVASVTALDRSGSFVWFPY